MRRRFALLVVLGVVFLGATAGCSTCGADCGSAERVLEFTGELIAVDEISTTWRTPDGVVRIDVLENVGFLDVGERYQVEAVMGVRSVVWETAVNDSCSCAGDVRHADGAPIDTGWWTGLNRNLPATEAVWLFLAIPIITLLAVGANRLRRGGDYDPYVDLPDDGSWLEYDGYVDDDGDPA